MVFPLWGRVKSTQKKRRRAPKNAALDKQASYVKCGNSLNVAFFDSALGNLPPAIYAQDRRSRDAAGRDTALRGRLRAPSRCIPEPAGLK